MKVEHSLPVRNRYYCSDYGKPWHEAAIYPSRMAYRFSARLLPLDDEKLPVAQAHRVDMHYLQDMSVEPWQTAAKWSYFAAYYNFYHQNRQVSSHAWRFNWMLIENLVEV